VRRKGKTVDLGARLRKPSKAVADLLGNHEGDMPGDRSRSIRLQGSRCGIVQTGKDGQEPAGLHKEATETVERRWDISRCAPLHLLQNYCGVGRQFLNWSSLGKMGKHCDMTRHRSNEYSNVRSLIQGVKCDYSVQRIGTDTNNLTASKHVIICC